MGILTSFFCSLKINIIVTKIVFSKTATTANIKTVPTKKFVCCTVFGFAFTVLVNLIMRNTAAIKNAILQSVTILEKKRNAVLF